MRAWLRCTHHNVHIQRAWIEIDADGKGTERLEGSHLATQSCSYAEHSCTPKACQASSTKTQRLDHLRSHLCLPPDVNVAQALDDPRVAGSPLKLRLLKRNILQPAGITPLRSHGCKVGRTSVFCCRHVGLSLMASEALRPARAA
jgi:hypothetical protein